jgi:O-methyltransferase involved in polyketide biosynthesis
MEKEGTTDDIASTNDDATESKYWSAKLGYFEDSFVEHFLVHPEKVKKKGPILHKGYYTRVSGIRNLIDQFITCGGKQIVSLGAGFDTNYFTIKKRYSDANPIVNYFELDFPKIIKQKANFIQRSVECTSVLTDWKQCDTGNYTSSDYHLIGIDLRDLTAIESLLTTHGLSPDLPTLFLSECVLIYINSTDSANIIKWSADFFKSSMFVIYEMILPHDGFGKMMVQNLAERGVSLSSYHAYPDLQSQKKRMTDLGFTHSESMDMNKIYSNLLDKDEVRRISKIEFFDEYEEWILIQQHYCIVVATQDKSGNNIWATVTLQKNKS